MRRISGLRSGLRSGGCDPARGTDSQCLFGGGGKRLDHVWQGESQYANPLCVRQLECRAELHSHSDLWHHRGGGSDSGLNNAGQYFDVARCDEDHKHQQ